MNNYFNKPSSDTLRLSALFVATCACLMVAFSGALYASEPTDPGAGADSDTERDVVFFEQSLRLDSQHTPIDVRVYQGAEQTRSNLQVTASPTDAPGDAVCRSTFPSDAGEDHYEFHLQHLDTSRGTHIVLLEARSGDGVGPLDPPVYQIGFHLRSRDGAVPWSCSIIGRGEHTELDGGPKIAIEEVDGTPRLTRYDIADDAKFCGLRPEEDVGFEKFDTESARFVPASELEISQFDSALLQATVPDEPINAPMTDGYYAWIKASSDIRGAPAGAAVPRPFRLGDLDLSSVWLEGADELGLGEFATASLSTAARLRAVRIFPGHGASRESFEGHGRPTRLLLGFSDGLRYTVDLPQVSYQELIDTEGLYVELPEPITTRCVSVMILDAEPGTFADSDDEAHQRRGRAVAISEITPYSVFDADTEAETAARIVADIGREPSPERRDRIASLGALIPEAIVDAVADVLLEPDDRLRERTVSLLGRLRHERSLPVLQEHFHRVSIEDDDYRRTKRAIAQHGSLAAPTLLDILSALETDDRKYVDTVRMIGRIGSEIHLLRLISELGEGGPMLRSERIRAVASGGIGIVPRLISLARTEVDTEAGLDALTTLVFIGQRLFSDQQAEIGQVDALHQIYVESESRPHRIRAIEALGYFAHPDGVQLIGEDILAQDPDPVVRQFAATSLKLYPGGQARQALERALDDSSPDVRIAAIRALNHRDDSTKATDAVIDYIDTETWPRALHHALQLLARSSEPRALEAISEIVGRDLSAPAALMGVRSLRRAESALPIADIKTHLGDENAPNALVEQLVQLLAFSDPEEATPILISISDRAYDPIDDRPIEHVELLARRALLALGTSRTPEAKDFLLSVVVDEDRSHRDRSTALRGLSFFSEPELIDDLHRLAPQIPSELRPRFRQTLAMINNRLSIDDAGEDIQKFIDRLDQESQEDFEPFEPLEPADPRIHDDPPSGL